MRTLAVNLRKNGLDVHRYAWLVRSLNILLKAGISEQEAEKIISDVPVFCFKVGLNVEILVDLLKRFQAYCQTNPSDPGQCNVIIESFNMAREFYKKCITGNYSIQINQGNVELELKNLLEDIITDEGITKLNEGNFIAVITKEKVLEKIMDVIKNPQRHEDLFFDGLT